MRYIKTNSIYHRFCSGIVVIFLIVCPFFVLEAQNNTDSDPQETSKAQNNDQSQNDTESDTQETSKSQNNDQSQNDTESDTQETPKSQNNDQVPFADQDITSLLNEQNRKFADQTALMMVVFMPVLIILLIFLIWIFLRYRTLAQKLDDVRYRIDGITKTNNDLKQDLSVVNRRMQPAANTFDPNELYQALTNESQKNTQKILNQIRTLTPNSTNSSDAVLTEKKKTFETHKTPIVDEQISQDIVEFCACYNEAIIERQKWSNFVSTYKQNFKIDVVNAEERFLNPKVDIDPIFKTSSTGCFLACYIEDEKLYVIVPIYDLVVERSTYFPGAFGEVFECSQFDDRSNYRISELIQPAIFEPDDAKETWTLKKKGILDLYKT